WRRISYRESYGAVRRIGQALLNLGLNQERPVAILSDNSIDHALLALGAMHVGVPVAPISPAYSLMSKDFGKLKSIFELVQPGLTFVSDVEKYKAALAAVGAKPTSVAELLETNPGSTMEREFAKVKPESVAKILFTSGSTGAPKGVVNTHRMFYAAAALPQSLWDRIKALKPDVVMLSAWGSTETSPLASSVHFLMQRAGVIGLPVAGCELKLLPKAGKLEVRVRGANVTPGYYKRPDMTAAAFDDEGFYRIGDAVKFADPADAAKGIVFDGRLAEDFKLSTGTWVNAGAVRIRLIAAADPLIQDAVITGHDRDELGALVFLSPAARDLPPEEVRSRLRSVLRGFSGSSSTCPARLMVMTEPPSIDANEITDKGYMNQRGVIERRAALVEKLYSNDESVMNA